MRSQKTRITHSRSLLIPISPPSARTGSTSCSHEIRRAIKNNGRVHRKGPPRLREAVDPYNILVFSNHPQHYALDERHESGNRWATFISRKTRVPVHHEKALFDLWNAVNVYGNVPSKCPPPRESTITDQDVTPEEMRSKSGPRAVLINDRLGIEPRP
jgi:hypothetical protein